MPGFKAGYDALHEEFTIASGLEPICHSSNSQSAWALRSPPLHGSKAAARSQVSGLWNASPRPLGHEFLFRLSRLRSLGIANREVRSKVLGWMLYRSQDPKADILLPAIAKDIGEAVKLRAIDPAMQTIFNNYSAAWR